MSFKINSENWKKLVRRQRLKTYFSFGNFDFYFLELACRHSRLALQIKTAFNQAVFLLKNIPQTKAEIQIDFRFFGLEHRAKFL